MKNLGKRILSMFMVVVMCITTFVNLPTVNAYADSNNRIATYINLAKSKEVTDVDVSGLTEDQLRFLGVWLSNYFSPFMMEITGDSELTDSIKEEMAKALSTNLSFSEDLATQLVEIVYGYMKSTAKPIYPAIKLSDGSWQVFHADKEGHSKGNNTSYATFLSMMSGSADMVSGALIASDSVEIGDKDKWHTIKIEKKENCTLGTGEGLVNLRWGYFLTVDGEIPGNPDYYFLGGYSDEYSITSDSLRFFYDDLVSYDCFSGFSYDNQAAIENGQDAVIERLNGILDTYNNNKADDVADNLQFRLQNAYNSSGNTSIIESALAVCLWLLGQNYETYNSSMTGLSTIVTYPYKSIYLQKTGTFRDSNTYKDTGNPVISFKVDVAEDIFQVKSSPNYTADNALQNIDLNNPSGEEKFPASKGYFVWFDDNDEVHPIADFTVIRGANDTFTPSQLAFAECLLSGNVASGYGFSLTDLHSSDIGDNDSGWDYIYNLREEKSLSWDKLAAMTVYGTTMCVDCFGNIIQAGGVHQRVIMPACMNPYAWKAVNSDGEDTSDELGSSRMLANFIQMANVADISSIKEYSANLFLESASGSGNTKDGALGALRPHFGSGKKETDYWNSDFLSNLLAGSKDTIISVMQQHTSGALWWSQDGFFLPLPKGKLSTSYDEFNVVVFVDTLGAYDTGKDFSAFNPAVMSDTMISLDKDIFSNALADVDKPMIAWGSETAAAASTLYITYCWASLYDSSNKAETIGRLGYRLAVENLPSMKNKGITLTFDGSKIESDIVNWLYYILHPTKGFNYVVTWLTNKVNHFLLNWHSSMVGTNGVGAMTGTTKYRSHYGYVTTPDLSEIQWTDSLINLYNDCVPFLIVILLIIMVFAYLTGVLNLQHAIIGWLMFAIFTVMPVNLINTMVGESNRISQNIYGDKFTYWALIQNETYANAIDTAVQGDGSGSKEGYENYLRTLFNTNSMVYSNQGGESVLVKWQAPKKMASLVLSSEDAKSVSGLGSAGRQMLQGMLNKSYSGQSYVNDEDAVYMYRSYLDITNFSRYIWKYISAKGTGSYYDVFKNTYVDNATKVTSTPEDVVTSYTMTNYFPMNIDVFNFGITSFNQDIWDVEKYFAPTGGFENDSNRISELKKYINNNGGEKQLPKLAAHALYSENTYYYFSWKLYSDGLSPDSSISGSTGFKDLLLGDGKGGYFYDVNGSGALLDVMDMRHLFTDVIPYMKKGNDIVRAFDDVYGIFIYDGVPTEEGHWNDADVSTDPEWKAKYWHNLNVSRLYGVYCPWVDVMYDCSYAKPQKITVMGKSFVVQDPINPQSYTGSGRPMIFSEAEMEEYGLSEGDLTTVERLILKANKGYTERLFDLLNYYNFSDVSLNAAAAINCAFEFNSTFSESGIFSNNHNIYPQSFDLANFSYDAYLRFILSNTTNESMLETSSSDGAGTSAGETSGDFYERIVNNSSMTTVLVMLLLDVVSIYVLPAFRIFFLVAMFFTSFIIILVSAFRIEDNLNFGKKVAKQFFLPLILYFVATVVFSWVLSLFMGTGNNAVTQTNQISISMGDPVMVMLVMLALDIILLIIYWKIISMVIQDMKHGLKMVGGFISGLGGAAVGAVSGALAGAAGGFASGLSSGGTKIKNTYNGKKGEAEQASDSSTKPAQKGTGVENARANERGANGQSIKDEARDNAEMSPKEKQEVQTKTDAINKKAENGEISTVQSEKKVNLGKSNKDNSVEVKTSKEPKQNSGNSNANGGKKGKSGSIEQRQLGRQGNQSGSRKRSGSQRNNQSNGQKPNNNKGGQNVNRNNGGQKNGNNSNTKKRRSNNNGGGGNKGYRPQSGGRNRGKKS